MKVAFIITSLANKGPIIMVQALVQHLIEEGYVCDVYYFDDLTDLDFSCDTKKIGFFEPIDFSRYDIIHSHLFRPDVYCAYHYRKIKRAETKLISTIHTAIYDDLKFTYGSLISRVLVPIWEAALKKMDHVVVLTAAASAYYVDTPFKALSVINNGRDLPARYETIPEEDLREIADLKRNHTLLGAVCGIDSRKGLEQILDLLVIKKNYAFIVIGDGALRPSLEKIAMEYGVLGRFKIIGYRPDGYRYMPHFDLFLLPSRSEGMPLALLEAMALKVPVVCARIPALSSEFDEDIFRFFDLDDVSSLSTACQIMEESSDIYVRRAHQCYLNGYTTNQMSENYRKLYSSIVDMH